MIKITHSGAAGVSVLKHIYKKFPHADFEYTCTFTNDIFSPEKMSNIVEYARKISRFGRIGFVCNTIEEKEEIEHSLHSLSSNNTTFIVQSLPLLKPLIEENWEKKPETKSILRKHLLFLKSNNIDTLILASPEFDILQKEFAKKMGKNCTILLASEREAENIIQHTSEISCNNKKQFFVEKNMYSLAKFKQIAQKYFCEGISEKSLHTL